MFGFKKERSKDQELPSEAPKPGFFSRLKTGLRRTRDSIGGELSSLLRGKAKLEDELLHEIEERLLRADCGVDVTESIIDDLKRNYPKLKNTEISPLDYLQQRLQSILTPCQHALNTDNHKPFVMLFAGINGAGKTTTIGKVAKRLQAEGKSVMLAAGDTFRAAAIDQLQVWGERNNIPVIAQHTGADSASVIFDAISAASARGIDVLLADTAGRLHTQGNLMEEIKKVMRVCKKFSDDMPHEVMLVLDAGIGQNAIMQTREFNEAIGVTGLSITKLDGTAKGGVIFAIAKEFQIPIRYIGIGEGIQDLRPFDAKDFVSALFSPDDSKVST